MDNDLNKAAEWFCNHEITAAGDAEDENQQSKIKNTNLEFIQKR